MARLRWLALAASTLAVACSFDSSGTPTGSSVADATGTASESGTGDPGLETGDAGQTSGDGDPTTTATTGDGDGDPTTTGDGDGDPTTTTGDGDGDPTTTGDGDPTTTTGDGDGDPTTTGDGDGDGDPVSPFYGDCNDNDADCEADEYCLDPLLEGWFVCTQGCDGKDDCPAGPPGSNPVCLPIDGNLLNKACFLNCNGGDVCPDGMACETENLGFDKICVFD